MEKIWLCKNSGFTWYDKENIHVKGYLFDRADTLYAGENLLRYFEGIESSTDFEERVTFANGLFSVIIETGDECLVATDPCRTFPLFFIRQHGKWSLSDDPYVLARELDHPRLDHPSVTEFLATGYVTGDNTLIEEIRQIQAGEMIRFKNDTLSSHFYATFRCQTVREDPYPELRQDARTIFDGAFKRLIASLQGRPAIVPLSGGYDSRFIATMLRHYEYDPVITFTYGRKGSQEVHISEKVAKKLDFPWIFVEYTPELIRDFINDESFMDFVAGSGNMTSAFSLQEYFAVRHLRQEGLIPDNSVFVPGIYGNFLAGGMLYTHGNLSLEESVSQIAERIYRVKYTFKTPRKKDIPLILDRIEKCIQEKYVKDSDLAYSIHEDYDFKERYAKFITNLTSTYAFFGYEFRLPFSDRPLVDFFRKLPLQAKINKYLYDDILYNDFFVPYGIHFAHELRPPEPDEELIRRSREKNRINSRLPEWIRRLFIRKHDDLFFREITRYFKDDLNRKGTKIRIYGNSYRSLIIQWYTHSVEQFLKDQKKS